ncbi:TldD/PmbA family protein [Candidatus Heimdallarchaeota archaeon]|nr:MAG: TldD/PmbA family protein [Candidatus Heimdallarchaeota archaeon]
MYQDEEIKDLASKVLQKLEQKINLEEAEVYVQSLSHMLGGNEYRTPKVYQSINREGCAVRFYKDQKLYFVCFPLRTVLSDIENIKSITTFPIKCKKFEFPEIKMSQTEVSKIYDKRIASMNEEEIYSLSYSMSNTDETMKDIILDGSIRLSLERKAIANTTHTIAFEKSTWCDIDLRALYRGYDMISSAEKHLTSRQIPSSVTSIVEDLVGETIRRSSLSNNLIKVNLPILFSPMAISQLLSFTLIPNLIAKDQSKLASIDFSESFNLIDDGTIPGLPNSTAFDDEGISQSKTVIIDEGRFVSSLNNCQHTHNSLERTGNSFRVKMFEVFPRSYQAYPEVYPSNLLIGEGRQPFDEYLEDTKDFVLINSTHGYMTADHQTGTFKISANDAYTIEKGKIVGALPTFDVIGNMYDLLKDDVVFLKERKVVRPTNTPYSILAPFVATEKTTIFP